MSPNSLATASYVCPGQPAPFPPLATSCTSHPWDFAQFNVFPQADSPEGQRNCGSFAVGQEAPRAGQGRGWGWTPESLSLEQLIGFPLYREEQEPCTPPPSPPPLGTLLTSAQSRPHSPAPGSTLHAKAEGESLLIQKQMFLPPFLVAMETALPSPSWPVMSWGKRMKRPRQGGNSFIPS